jgi:hypothetical protein
VHEMRQLGSLSCASTRRSFGSGVGGSGVRFGGSVEKAFGAAGNVEKKRQARLTRAQDSARDLATGT